MRHVTVLEDATTAERLLSYGRFRKHAAHCALCTIEMMNNGKTLPKWLCEYGPRFLTLTEAEPGVTFNAICFDWKLPCIIRAIREYESTGTVEKAIST